MSFASDYLSEKTLFDPFFKKVADQNTGIIVVIPAFDEEDIPELVDSLYACEKPTCEVEVIILLNSPQKAEPKQIKQNQESVEKLENWKNRHTDCFFQLLVVDLGRSSDKDWGAGMARKAVMDEALRRFSAIGNEKGIIASLDADCKVSSNYLLSLYKDFYCKDGLLACSLYFEHPLSGTFPKEIYEAISRYELHLRYYYQILKETAYPNVFHTVGSAMAVKAEAYSKAGGMNRRQAGEDFYFIQKLIPTGAFFYLNNLIVMPSPRASLRVPFGTGPIISSLISADKPELLTYNPDSFKGLRSFFASVNMLYKAEPEESVNIISKLDVGIRDFLQSINWQVNVSEIRNNTSSSDSFNKRFYSWFNMFRIVKYLNFVHSKAYFEKIEVTKAAKIFLGLIGQDSTPEDAAGLLLLFRKMEK